MDTERWLEGLGLGEYAASFNEEAVDLQILPDLSENDLMALGVSRLGHRKRLLSAIESLRSQVEPSLQAPYPVELAPERLPGYLAQPLAAYWNEPHPRVKLHCLVDTAEVALRWVVAMALAEVVHSHEGTLPDRLATELRQHIERPTLGRWLGMLRILSRKPPSRSLLVPRVFELSARTFGPNFTTETDGGTAETSLLVLRNHLAHGGGVSNREAERLHDCHQQRFLDLLADVAEVSAGACVVVRDGDQGRRLQGLDPTHTAVPNTVDNDDAGPWLVGESGTLPLAPLLAFGPVTRTDAAGDAKTLPDSESPQVYARAEAERVVFTPLGVDAASTESISISAFRTLFRLDEARKSPGLTTADGYPWDDFLAEARRIADDLVGRRDELDRLKQWFKGRDSRDAGTPRLGWLHGGPGLGKSLLAARVAADLSNAPVVRQGIYCHRFRTGDPRNSARAFLRGLQAALVAWAPLAEFDEPDGEADDGANLEADVRRRLEAIKDLPPAQDKAPAPRFVVLVDGLDEGFLRDKRLPHLLVDLAVPGTLWLVASRPDRAIGRAFANPICESVFMDGLPPMDDTDVRAMLLEHLGLLGRQLVARDKDQGSRVLNPFVEAVVTRAEGLPLYVRLVIEDLTHGTLSLHDEAKLPVGLTDYYNTLLARLGVSDIQRDLTLITAVLACAREPLTANDLAIILPADPAKAERYQFRIARALAAGRSLLRTASTTTGESGYALYHHSFCEHVLTTPGLAGSVAEAQETLCQFATAWQSLPATHLRRHLFRWGTEYALWWQGGQGAKAAFKRLTDFSYLQARLHDIPKAADVNDLVHEYSDVANSLSMEQMRQYLAVWEHFMRQRAHLIRRGHNQWPSYKILLQLAMEHADNSPVTQAAEAWLAAGHCGWEWLKNRHRDVEIPPTACQLVMEGHHYQIAGVEIVDETLAISWGWDGLISWDLATGTIVARIETKNAISGALTLPDGNVVFWQSDSSEKENSSTEESALRIANPRTGEVVNSLEAGSGSIRGAVLLPDMHLIAWTNDGAIHAWNLANQSLERTYQGHTGMVYGVRVLPDGRLISWGDDESVRIWDGATGSLLHALGGHNGGVTDILLTDDNKLVSWNADLWALFLEDNFQPTDFAPRIWDLEAGELIATLEGHTETVRQLLAMSDGTLVTLSLDESFRRWCATDSYSSQILYQDERNDSFWEGRQVTEGLLLAWQTMRGGEILLLDVESGAVTATLDEHTDSVKGIELLPDEEFVSWSDDGTLRVWSTDTDQSINVLTGHTGSVSGSKTLPDGRLLSWSSDRTLRVWDPHVKAPSSNAEQTEYIVESLPDRQLLTTKDSGTLHLWDVDKHTLLHSMPGHEARVKSCSVLDNGRLVSWGQDRNLRVWALASGRLLHTLSGHTAAPTTVTELPGNRLLSMPYGSDLADLTDFTPRIWDLRSGQILHSLEAHTDTVYGRYSLGPDAMLTYSRDGTIRRWNLDTGINDLTFNGHSAPIAGITILEGNLLLSWAQDDTLRLWDVSTGSELQVYPGRPIRHFSEPLYLPNRRFIAGSGDDEKPRLNVWTLDSDQPCAALDGHSGRIQGLQLLEDNRLISWSQDATARLWDLSSGDMIRKFEGHKKGVSDAKALQNGRLLTASEDETIRVWDLSDGKCLNTFHAYCSDLSHTVLTNQDTIMLSWTDNGVGLRLSDLESGEETPWEYFDEAGYTRPHWLASKNRYENLTAGSYVAWDGDKTIGVSRFRSALGVIAEWHSEGDFHGGYLSRNGLVRVQRHQPHGHQYGDSVEAIIELWCGNERMTLTELDSNG